MINCLHLFLFLLSSFLHYDFSLRTIFVMNLQYLSLRYLLLLSLLIVILKHFPPQFLIALLLLPPHRIPRLLKQQSLTKIDLRNCLRLPRFLIERESNRIEGTNFSWVTCSTIQHPFHTATWIDIPHQSFAGLSTS